MITSSFTKKVGDITVEIDSIAEDVFHVLSISPISYEFDMEDNSPDVDMVQVLYNKCNISCRYLTDERNDLYDLLMQEIGIGELDVNIRITARAVPENWLFRFSIDRNCIEITEDDRKVDIALKPKTKTGKSYLELMNIIDDALEVNLEVSQESGGPDPVRAVSFGTFVWFALQETFGLEANIKAHADSIGKLQQTLNDGDYVFIVTGDDTGGEPFDGMKQVAAIEGAVFGGGFNRSFWLWKGATGDIVELDSNDMKTLSFQQTFDTVRSIDLGIWGTTNAYISQYINAKTLDITSYESVKLRVAPIREVSNSSFSKAYYRTNPVRFEYPSVITADLEQTLVDTSILTYENSMNKPARIKTDVIGIHKVRPWNTLRFASDVKQRYRNKSFRPYSLSYNLETDIAKVEAYQIGS